MGGGIYEEPLVAPSSFLTEDSLEGMVSHSAGPSPRELIWPNLFTDPGHMQVLLGRLGLGEGLGWEEEVTVFYCSPLWQVVGRMRNESVWASVAPTTPTSQSMYFINSSSVIK